MLSSARKNCCNPRVISLIQRRPLTVLLTGLLLATAFLPVARASDKKVKTPIMEDVGDGTRRLLMPDDVMEAVFREFPGSRMPVETDFSDEMKAYYNERLIGVHPAVAFGDFNGDKKRDYLLLLITGDTKWGPICELVVAGGAKKGFDIYRLGEVYNFKDNYVSFQYEKLLMGRFKKGAWYITWDPKKKQYNLAKS